MTTGPVTTVGRLRATLAAYPSDAPILIAVQPGSPPAVLIGTLTTTTVHRDQDNGPHGTAVRPPDNADSHGEGGVVWIARADPIGCLPAIARDALGGRCTPDTAPE